MPSAGSIARGSGDRDCLSASLSRTLPLDRRHKSLARFPSMPLRSRIAGAGFIGAVHAHAVRAAGGRWRPCSPRPPSAARRPRERLGRNAPPPALEDWSAPTTWTWSTSARRTTCTTSSPTRRWRPASTSSARSRWPSPRAAPSGSPPCAAAAPALLAAVPFVYRYHPMVREAAGRVAAGEAGAVRLLHGTYLQDWLLPPEDDNWRVDADLGGAVAGVRRHRLALVRPGRVRHRRPDHPAARAPSPRAGAAALGDGPAFARGDGGGERAPVDTEDAAVVQFRDRPAARRLGGRQPVSAGRKNRLWFEVDGRRASLAFDQEEPESLWVGGRDARTLVPRPRARPATAAAAVAAARRAPAGLPGLLRRFRRRRLRRDPAAAAPDGLPTFADGARAAADHRRGGALRRDAVGRRRRPTPAWKSRWPHEARLPHRLPARSARSRRSPRGPPAHGYEALEVAAWPGPGDRPFTATHLAVDGLRRRRARRRPRRCWRARADAVRRSPTTTTTCTPTRPSGRRSTTTCTRSSTRPRCSACPTVGTFVGRDPGRSVAENLREAERVFRAAGRPRRRARRASSSSRTA